MGLEGEAMWMLLRENLVKFGDIAEWSKLLTGPMEPVIAPEDRDFLALAKALLQTEPWDDTTWGQWTDMLKTTTGRKGKALFLPLRQALTGMDHGPDMAALLPLIGLERAAERLRSGD